MNTRTLHTLGLALICASLTACGGGGDAANPASTTTAAAASCDPTLFSTSVATPTSAQLTALAKTYTGDTGSYDMSGTFIKSGTATLVLAADGSVSYNGAAVDVKSLCFEAGAATQPLYIHWGTKTTVGAGAVYDHHVDLFNNGTYSGFINNTVFKSP
jgi:hypothetical protein